MQNDIEKIMNQFTQFGIQSHSTMGGVGLWWNELECLAWAALNSNFGGDFLEIGAFNGGSAVLFCIVKRYLQLISKVISVDLKFNDWFDFLVYKRGKFDDICMKIETDSRKLNEYTFGQLDLVFDDGFHSFSNVIMNFTNIQPYTTDKTLFLFHDTSPHIFDPNYQKRQLEFAEKHFDELMVNRDEDFFVDEAIFYLCNQFDYTLIDIPIADHKECHSKETNLTKWIRGKTSPFNSIVAIQKRCNP